MEDMHYCTSCGTELVMKEHADGGPVPFCPACGKYRHPGFSTAVIMIVQDPSRSRILLIRQYGRPHYILVAGYIERGEDAEDAVVREIREELGVKTAAYRFLRSRYFPPTNTLMLNYSVVLETDELRPNGEIDDYAWFSFAEAGRQIRPGSLAEAFLRGYLDGGQYTWPVF